MFLFVKKKQLVSLGQQWKLAVTNTIMIKELVIPTSIRKKLFDIKQTNLPFTQPLMMLFDTQC